MALIRALFVFALMLALSGCVAWLAMTSTQRSATVALLAWAMGDAPVGVQRMQQTPPPVRALAPRPVGRPAGLEYAGARTACVDRSLDTAEVEQAQVYRWTDENGRVVFGDKPPQAAQAEFLGDDYGASEQFVRVSLDDRGSAHASALSSAFPNDVRIISIALRSELDLQPRQIDVSLEVHGSRASMGAGMAAADAHAAGYYMGGRNTIVLSDQRSLQGTQSVARHEAVHAILGSLYGPTPPWINEGLAEVFEVIEVAGQARVLPAHRSHVRTLSGEASLQTPGALRDLLDVTHAEWSTRPVSRNYAPSWALVHLLLSEPAGRDVLQAVLTAQAAAPCRTIDSVMLVHEGWPGGLPALERSWQQRMRSAAWAPIRF